jgi:hypothetical protein
MRGDQLAAVKARCFPAPITACTLPGAAGVLFDVLAGWPGWLP